jgi:hypothetical protein
MKSSKEAAQLKSYPVCGWVVHPYFGYRPSHICCFSESRTSHGERYLAINTPRSPPKLATTTEKLSARPQATEDDWVPEAAADLNTREILQHNAITIIAMIAMKLRRINTHAVKK